MPLDKAARSTVAPFLSAFTVLLLVLILAFTFIVFTFSSGRIDFFKVQGNSMAPTMLNGQTAFMRSAPLEKHQIAVFEVPKVWGVPKVAQQEDTLLIKRVQATEGDTISAKNGDLLINGEKLVELPENCSPQVDTIVVPEDQLFLVGDNHSRSFDSVDVFCKSPKRSFVHEDSVVYSGKLIFSI